MGGLLSAYVFPFAFLLIIKTQGMVYGPTRSRDNDLTVTFTEIASARNPPGKDRSDLIKNNHAVIKTNFLEPIPSE